MEKRVVITGIGFTTSIGNQRQALWGNIKNGTSGARFIEEFDTSKSRIKVAAKIPNFEAEKYFSPKELNLLDLVAQYGVFAASEAYSDAGLNPELYVPWRAGVFWGTGLGGMETLTNESIHFYNKGRVWPYLIPSVMYNATAYEIAKRFSLQGANLTLTTACSSSNNAIGVAYQHIKSGQVSLAVVGGSDAPIIPYIIQAWSELRGAVSTENNNPASACKPFSKNRNGMLIGEGAGALICEELEHAQRRGAHIYGEIIGYGSMCDTQHITSPTVDGQSIAIKAALDDADIKPEAIDYINAHGTGTYANDKTETGAIKQVFGSHAYRIPINSSKPLIGHLMGASGAVEMIIGLLSMQENTVHSTINYEEVDEECDLDYVTQGNRAVPIDIFMSNSFAFGGSHAVLIVKRFQE